MDEHHSVPEENKIRDNRDNRDNRSYCAVRSNINFKMNFKYLLCSKIVINVCLESLSFYLSPQNQFCSPLISVTTY